MTKARIPMNEPWLYAVAFFVGVVAAAFTARWLDLKMVPPVFIIFVGSIVQAGSAYSAAKFALRLALNRLGKALFLRMRTQLVFGTLAGVLSFTVWTGFIYLILVMTEPGRRGTFAPNGTVALIVICGAFFLPPWALSCLIVLGIRKYSERWLLRKITGE